MKPGYIKISDAYLKWTSWEGEDLKDLIDMTFLLEKNGIDEEINKIAAAAWESKFGYLDYNPKFPVLKDMQEKYEEDKDKYHYGKNKFSIKVKPSRFSETKFIDSNDKVINELDTIKELFGSGTICDIYVALIPYEKSHRSISKQLIAARWKKQGKRTDIRGAMKVLLGENEEDLADMWFGE